MLACPTTNLARELESCTRAIHPGRNHLCDKLPVESGSWCQLSLVVNAMFLIVRLLCLNSCCCDSLPIIFTQMLWDGGLWSPHLSTLVSASMADGTLSHIYCFQELLPIVMAVAVWLVIVGKAHIFCHSQNVADGHNHPTAHLLHCLAHLQAQTDCRSRTVHILSRLNIKNERN